MSTSSGPNSSAESNLVFAFDMADTKNSFKGQPATNIWESGDPNGHGSILEKIYTNKFLNKTIDSGVVYHNIVNRKATIDSPDKTFFNNGGLNMGSMNFQTLRSDTRYIQISFDYYGVKPYQRFCCPHLGLNGYLGISYTDGTTNTSGWDTTYSPGDGDDWNNLEENMGKWQRISLIATVHPDRVPQGIWAMYIYYDSLMYGQGYFTNMIFTEHASYPTGPVRFTQNTRSRHTSLYNLVGNTSMDVATLTLNSENKLILDGTNDYYRTGVTADSQNINHEFTFEYVIYFDSEDSVDGGDGWGLPGYAPYWGYSNRFYKRTDGMVPVLRYQDSNGSWQDTNSNSGVIPFNRDNHVCVVKGPGYVKHYYNGELLGEGIYPDSGYDNTRTSLKLGIVGWSFISAKITTSKIYNKALTAEEVQKNFKVIQKRFNIE